MTEEKSYGKITVGTGTTIQKDLQVLDMVQAQFTDNRLITCAGIEGNTFLLAVENPESTGRATSMKMWVSRESFFALITTALMYLNAKRLDAKDELQKCVRSGDINYCFSDNLQQIDFYDDLESGEKGD